MYAIPTMRRHSPCWTLQLIWSLIESVLMQQITIFVECLEQSDIYTCIYVYNHPHRYVLMYQLIPHDFIVLILVLLSLSLYHFCPSHLFSNYFSLIHSISETCVRNRITHFNFQLFQ